MAPKKIKQAGPTRVDSITHGDKRTNIPTADAHAFVDPVIEEIRKVRYSRDESLDPQLVWRGKYPSAADLDGTEPDLVVDAPPIYIQEKIDPRVLIENLRRTAARPEDEPELTLFESFDGLGGLDQVDFYKHDANWSNRMILGDSLQVMASLAEREKLRGAVQMVYIDPPYGIKFGSNWQVSARDRSVKDGKLEDTPREAEVIKAFRDTWEFGVNTYLSHLRDRFIVARDLLNDSGSIFVQIGDDNVHLVRAVLDEVFGPDNFVSQIAFSKTTGLESVSRVASQFDYLLWYAKSSDSIKYRPIFEAKDPVEAGFNQVELPDGSTRALTKSEREDPRIRPIGKLFMSDNLTKPGPGAKYEIEVDGVTYNSGRRWWGTPKGSLEKLVACGRILATGKTLRYLRYFDDFPYRRLGNLWGGFGGASDPVYVVQTNTEIVQRCLLMTTDPGDLVVDPTCGSGTTAHVCEHWGRRWITCDTSRVALALARIRLMGSSYPWYLLADSEEGREKEGELLGQQLPKEPTTRDVRQGFVYERVRHVTQSTISNNPDIRPESSRDDVEQAIRRHAAFELLRDQPFQDTAKVRVAGPFTVESLSPHRSLAFGDQREPLSETEATTDADSPSFAQSILDNLAKSGIQNGRRHERIGFAAFERYAGDYIQAIGQRDGEGGDSPSRIAVAIGPQYGTVSPSYVKKAAREAIDAEGVDLLAILGFAFDPQVTGLSGDDKVSIEATDEDFASVAAARKLGRIPVLMVRMNVDLLMGEELKKTGAGNLFTVFGKPDIAWSQVEDGIVVDLKGVDVYDPTTGEVRSNSTDQVSMWMIDTNYDEESFFVRHCYFTGDNDPYKRLKTALKAEINEEAWATLYRTTSRPFSKPETGKFAVKVINDYGDEVMKVFEV
jgi:adenine-specific DNA-methyltransferase